MSPHDHGTSRGAGAPPSSLIARLRQSRQFEESHKWDSGDHENPTLFAVVDATRRLSAAGSAAAFRTALSKLVPNALRDPPWSILFIAAGSLGDDDVNEFILRSLCDALGEPAFLQEIGYVSNGQALSRAAREATEAIGKFLPLATPMAGRSLLSFGSSLSRPTWRTAFRQVLLIVDRPRPLADEPLSRLIGAVREAMKLFGFGSGIFLIADTQGTDLGTLTLNPGNRDERIDRLCTPEEPVIPPTDGTDDENPENASRDRRAADQVPATFWDGLAEHFQKVLERRRNYDPNGNDVIARMQDLVDLACRPSYELIGRVQRAFRAFAVQAAHRAGQARTADRKAAQASPDPLPPPHDATLTTLASGADSPRPEVDWSKLEKLDDGAPAIDETLDAIPATDLPSTIDPRRLPPRLASPLQSLPEQTASPQDEPTDAAHQSWTAAAFLKVLEAVFPDLMRETWNHEENLYRLYLLLSWAASPGSEEPLALKDPRWQRFLADERLLGCCRFAFAPAGGRGEPLVQPFASARALYQHLSGLMRQDNDLSAERWNQRVLQLNHVVTEAIESTTAETRLFRERLRSARQNTRPLVTELMEQTREVAATVAGETPQDPMQTSAAYAKLAPIIDRIVVNDSYLLRAQQEIAAREREGFPKSLYRWLIDAERYFDTYADISRLTPPDCNEYGHRYLSVLEIWCAGPQTLKPWMEILEAINRCIALLERAAEQSQVAVIFEATLFLVRAHSFALIAFERADAALVSLREEIRNLDKLKADNATAIETAVIYVAKATAEAQARDHDADEAEREAATAEQNAAAKNAAASEQAAGTNAATRQPTSAQLKAEAEALMRRAQERRRAAEQMRAAASQQRSIAKKREEDRKRLLEGARQLKCHRQHIEQTLEMQEQDLARAQPRPPHHRQAHKDALANATRMARGHPDLQLNVRLVATLLNECDGRWTDAETEYLRIQESADEAGYIEIAARAGYSAMRARAQQVSQDERRGLFWAQGFLRLYAARSPFMSNRDHALFVSYRRDTQPWVRDVCQAYEKNGKAKIWVDYDSIIDGNADYRAEMQLGLDRADWIVLVLSPGYFESPWCTYELTTALARRRLNSQSIAWVCVDDNCPADRRGRPAEHARELAKAASRFASEMHFFNTQLDLVLNQTCLNPQVVITRGTTADEQRSAVVASIAAFANP